MKATAGLVLLAVAVMAIAWGVHDIAQIGTCGGDEGAPPCPPEIGPAFVAVFCGIIGAVAAGFLSPSGRFLSATLALIFGAAGLSVLWSQLGPSAQPGVDPNPIKLAVGAAALLLLALPAMVGSVRGGDSSADASGDGFWSFEAAVESSSDSGGGDSGCSSGCGGGCGGGD